MLIFYYHSFGTFLGITLGLKRVLKLATSLPDTAIDTFEGGKTFLKYETLSDEEENQSM